MLAMNTEPYSLFLFPGPGNELELDPILVLSTDFGTWILPISFYSKP